MSKRLIYLLSFLAVLFILLDSLYAQFYGGFEPCPLCTLQRLTFMILSVLFLLGVIFASFYWMRLLVNFFALLASAMGVFLAGRQVWLQHFPPSGNMECGVSLQYMMQILPFNKLIQKVFEGTAECTQHTWSFLGFTMAEWALFCFCCFFVLSLFLLANERRTV